jgi:galactonate dehydratase
MKIKNYELYQVPPRWLFLKIETDEGITGWGEPVIEGKAATVKAAVHELMEALTGKDPMNIEDHWNTMYRGGFYRGGPILMSALAGIDQALWDIKGKFFNAPIYQLLGGKCREKMRVYSWIGGDRPSDIGNLAKQARDNGFTAVKMNATDEMQYIDSHKKIDWVLERVSALRDAVGMDLDVGIDFHGRLHKPMAKVLAKQLEAFRPMFIEEPVLPENNEALRRSIPPFLLQPERECTVAGISKKYLRTGLLILFNLIFHMLAVLLNARRYCQWQRRMMWLLRRIVRWDLLPSLPVCR